MVDHGVVSLAVFLLIGLAEARTGTDVSRSLGGLADRRPVALDGAPDRRPVRPGGARLKLFVSESTS